MSVNTTYIEGDVAVSRNATVGGEAIVRGNATLDHNLKVKGWLDAQNIKGNNKGLFSSLDLLRESYPRPLPGWFAAVVDDSVEPATTVLYTVVAGLWTQSTGNPDIVTEAAMFNSGQMLKETNIVNDLTTGGEDDVLSAEQGKLLAKEVREAKGVFDISYANRTSDDIADYARYESLSAALAAVPTAMQAGGMMVKFILRTNTGTDDNPVYVDRYVGYKLMSVTWSTAVANWQGVDDRPTQGSKNLVLSGGVWYDLNNIDWENLTEGLKNIILTVTHQGIPLTTEWGNNNDIGITQKTLTESRDNLQSQIDAIVAGDTAVNITVSPSAIKVGATTSVNVSATASRNATTIKIAKNGVDMSQTACNTDHLTISDSLAPTVKGTTNYKGKFVIAGNNKETTTRTVTAVYPIFYAVGATRPATSSSDWQELPARTTAVGVQLPDLTTESGDYIFIEVPNGIPMGDIYLDDIVDTKLEKETVTTDRVDGEGGAYTCYENVEPRGAGTYNYKIQ